MTVDPFVAHRTTNRSGTRGRTSPRTWCSLPTGAASRRRCGCPCSGRRRWRANLLRAFPELAVNPEIGTISLNGAVGLRIADDVGGTTIVGVVVEDGRITRIFALRNPRKLTRLDWEAELTR